MLIKSAMVYRLTKPLADVQVLDEQLARNRFQPCGNQDQLSRGWVPPVEDGALVYAQGDYRLLSMATQVKLLPSAVINEEAEKRAVELAVQQGYPVGRKQMKELKERVRDELLPRAFVRTTKLWIWVDTKAGVLVVNAASMAKADEALELLGKSLDDFGIARLNTVQSPVAAMTDWLAGGEAPTGFSIDRECEVKSSVEEKASVRYARHTLEGDDVRQHIAQGKLPTRLALTWNDRVSFVLTDKLEVKKLAFLDVVKEGADNTAENKAEQFDADVALMSGELSKLLAAIVGALGGEVEQAS